MVVFWLIVFAGLRVWAGNFREDALMKVISEVDVTWLNVYKNTMTIQIILCMFVDLESYDLESVYWELEMSFHI